MRIISYEMELKSRSDVVTIVPFGDIHILASNCARTPLKKAIREVKDNPLALWFGGGDILNAISPHDAKRFDFKSLPASAFVGDADTVKDRLANLIAYEIDEAVSEFEPIKDKCLFLLEGNHEKVLRKRDNYDAQETLCKALGAVNGWSATWIRLTFRIGTMAATVVMGARHGYGGGRSPGAEPRKLQDLQHFWADCEIVWSGHTHTAEVPSPLPHLYLPRSGEIPKELQVKYRYAANWGSWLYTHAAGASTYDEDCCYPPRPLIGVKALITPFWHTSRLGRDVTYPKIELRSTTL